MRSSRGWNTRLKLHLTLQTSLVVSQAYLKTQWCTRGILELGLPGVLNTIRRDSCMSVEEATGPGHSPRLSSFAVKLVFRRMAQAQRGGALSAHGAWRAVIGATAAGSLGRAGDDNLGDMAFYITFGSGPAAADRGREEGWSCQLKSG
ncbi:uncharacterized protein BDZ99DRAFT_87923 [Mytilinidion resinicola]|uniref:Uncharacterized protein n=1 Tax=Mytilinidion resinicola TaxID=574789 RepID=A0A6A6YFT3_9PEZI|nr:uncharacterized protein BDZ99DRAFT_87923 [Mytilinidion resinicola]KAF2806905.1 hypothetical protein BDZ99DRAFT_87923 [Mytilinidion resinicola]